MAAQINRVALLLLPLLLLVMPILRACRGLTWRHARAHYAITGANFWRLRLRPTPPRTPQREKA
jgi:hypothetical protein